MSAQRNLISWIMAALGASSLQASAQQVHVVHSGGSIGAAIESASDGDIVLLDAGGTYPGFNINGKSIAVVVDGGGTANVQPPVWVGNIGPTQYAVLRGLYLWDDYLIWPPLQISGCAGPVWLEDCTMIGGGDIEGIAPGAVLTSCSSVLMHRCTLQGAPGWYEYPFPGPGETALNSQGSFVTLVDSICQGGDGSPPGHGIHPCSTPGGAGAMFSSGFLFASGTVFKGGAGGAHQSACGLAAGGAGLLANAEVNYTECSFVGGKGGSYSGGPSGPFGPTGPRVTGSGPFTHCGRLAHSFDAPATVRELEDAEFSFVGVPDEIAFVTLSRAPSVGTFEPDQQGVVLVDFDFAVDVLAFGPLPFDGALSAFWTAPLLPPSLLGVSLFAQAVFTDATGETEILGPASSIVVLSDRL